DQDRVDAALRQRARVVPRGLEHRAHAAVPARTAGQGTQMHHADDGLLRAEDREEAHVRAMIASALGQTEYNAAVVELALASFAAFFVTINPIEAAAIFPVLTAGSGRTDQRRIAAKGTLIAGGLLLMFTLLGDDLLRVVGISLPAVRVGGGVLLMLVS